MLLSVLTTKMRDLITAAQQVEIQAEGFLRRFAPGEKARPLPSTFYQRSPQITIANNELQLSSDRGWIFRIEQQTAAAEHLGQACSLRSQNRNSRGHRFHQLEPEAFVARGMHQCNRSLIERGQIFVGDSPGTQNSFRKPSAAIRSEIAANSHLCSPANTSVRRFLGQLRESFHQRTYVFSFVEAAEKKKILHRQTILFADQRNLFDCHLLMKAGTRRVVNHRYALRRHTMKPADVLLRKIGNRNVPVGAAPGDEIRILLPPLSAPVLDSAIFR
jgi:hypothetical protein